MRARADPDAGADVHAGAGHPGAGDARARGDPAAGHDAQRAGLVQRRAAAGRRRGGGNGGNDNPPGAGEVEPLPSETPAPTVTPVPPAEPTGPPAEPPKVFVNEDDDLPIPLIVLGAIAVLCALLALLYALLSRLGWADRALTPVRRSWREARFRAGGTWGDFADWMRLGR